jgi:hypothetical protein
MLTGASPTNPKAEKWAVGIPQNTAPYRVPEAEIVCRNTQKHDLYAAKLHLYAELYEECLSYSGFNLTLMYFKANSF